MMKQALQTYYNARYPAGGSPQVGGVADITTGWECEVFTYALDWGPAGGQGQQALILRLYPGDDGAGKAEREFYVLSQLGQVDFPVPRVYALEKDAAQFGRPAIIMEKIAGEGLWSELERAPVGRQTALITQMVSMLVRLHALDWRLFEQVSPVDPSASPYAFVDYFLGYGRQVTSRYGFQGFDQALGWIEARRELVPCGRPALAHLDFHPGNILTREDGSFVVIDWTASMIMDRRFDLAWTCLLCEIYSGREARDFIFREYERISGAPVEHFEVYEVLACLRRLSDILISVSLGAEKLGMRPGAEEIMLKEVGPFQKVYDLFRARTGLRLAEVEGLIERMSGK